MKTSFKLSAFLLLSFFSTSLCNAYDCVVDGIYYNISSEEEMTASVTFRSVKSSIYVNKDYSSPYSGTLVIPPSIMVSNVQYTVTSIGDHAFEDCADLESVVLPESITVLGESAFQESGLQTVELPTTINTIGRSAFYHCNNLKTIVIPEGVTELGPDVFRGCSSLVSVVFSENCGIEGISLWAFQNCNNLRSINLPKSLIEINKEAFSGCISLKKITLPGSLLIIGEDAFSGCIALDSLIIPAEVETIEGNPFSGCTSLEYISVVESNPNFDSREKCNAIIASTDGIFFDRTKDCLICACKNTVIPNSVTTIGNKAFYGHPEIPAVRLPQGIVSFGADTFDNGIKVVYMKGAAEVDSVDISGLTTPLAIVPSGERVIGNFKNVVYVNPIGQTLWHDDDTLYAIVNDNLEMRMVITSADKKTCKPSHATVVEGKYTYGLPCISNKTAKSVIIPSDVAGFKVNEIGDRAFQECKSLTEVFIPEGVKKIGEYAFDECNNIKSFDIPYGLEAIETCAFSACRAITSFEIPKSVTSIGGWAFYWNTNLQAIEIPNGVTSIGNRAFYQLANLVSATIPSSVSNIGQYAFYGSKKLKNVKTYLRTPIEIDSTVFEGINNQAVLYVPKGCKNAFETAWKGFDHVEEFDDELENRPTADKDTELLGVINGLDSVSTECANNYRLVWQRNRLIQSVEIDEQLSMLANYAADGRRQKEIARLIQSWLLSMESHERIVSQVKGVNFELDSVQMTLSMLVGKMTALENEAMQEWKIKHMVTNLTELNNVLFADRIMVVAGGQAFLSIQMNNTANIRGFQFDLCLPEGISITTDADGSALAELSTERTTAKRHNSFLTAKQSDGSLRVLCGSQQNYIFDGNEGEVAKIMLTISTGMKEGLYPITLKKVKMTDQDGVTTYSIDTVKSVVIVVPGIYGDVNGDKDVDVTDFISVANHIMGVPNEHFEEQAGDVNSDGNIDVADFIGVANLILYDAVIGNGNTSMRAVRRGTTSMTVFNDLENVIYIEPTTTKAGSVLSLSVRMKNTSPIRGFQFDLYLPEGISVVLDKEGEPLAELSNERTTATHHDNFFAAIQPNGALRVLCGSFSNYTFEGNDGEVAKILVQIDSSMVQDDYTLYLKKIKLTESNISHTYSTASIESFITVNKIYRLTYIIDGETFFTDSLIFNTAITPLIEPTREGYSFSGWSEIPATMPAQDVEVNGSFSINKYLLTVLIDGENVYSDSIIFGSLLKDYVELIINQGIDLSQWEWYGQIDIISMPAHDVIINAVRDVVSPILIESDNTLIYDLTGKKIDTKDINTLPSGIYIRNGRKFIIE